MYIWICMYISAGLVFALDDLASVLAVGRLGVIGKNAVLRLCEVLFIRLWERFGLQNASISPACFAENNVDRI